MRMGYELVLEQQQKLIMTPELKLALKVLQLPSLELETLIQHELEVNPVLDIVEEIKEEKNDIREKEQKENEIDWREYFQFQGKSYEAHFNDNDESSELSYENIITYSPTLKDNLLTQLYLAITSAEDKEIGEFLIESLDENGYLTISVEEAAEMLCKDVAKILNILKVIHTSEPCGVGARDIKECLLIQLKNKGLYNSVMDDLINNYLDDIAANRLQHIAKKLSITVDQAQKYSDIVKRLDPKPGRAFEDNNSTRYVVPDIFIEKSGDEYTITINDQYGLRLTINQYYKDILRYEDKASQASLFINNKLASAMWLIKSIEHRRITLGKVMKAILDYQLNFFEKGSRHLKTMTLKAIADAIGVHESTVSRAINGKYVQTPRGTFEIKYFFKSGIGSSNGESVSSESIKRIMRDFIDKESSSKPLCLVFHPNL